MGNRRIPIVERTKLEHTSEMGFSFVHTADWQIGKSFGTFQDETAALLRAARLDAVDRLAAAARAANARNILVAGDVFDHVRPPQKTVGQLMARLGAQRDLVWHLLPGNHDPAQPGSLWDDLPRTKPANVRIHQSPEPVEIETDVVLLPAPLRSRAMSTDPTAYMDRATTTAGTIRIGMAHGSVRGFNSDGEPVIPIDVGRAGKARLDYLALGDWHGLQQIDNRTWYSGTHEPDGYKDNAPGHALIVGIAAAGAAPHVRPISTAHYRWKRHELFIDEISDLDRFSARIAEEASPSTRLLLKLVVRGRVPLADYGSISDRIDSLAHGLANLDADTSGLATTTSEDDLAALGTGSIAGITRQIAAMTTSSDPTLHQPAIRALRTLARLAEQTP